MELMKNAEGFPLDDVFTVDDVRDAMMRKYEGELEDKAERCYFTELEPHWGWNRGEINIFYGGGNMGKSSFSNELCLLKSIKDGNKWGYFSPENHPAVDFFNDFAKKYLGTQKYWLEEREKYVEALDFVNDHVYFVYGEDKSHDDDFIFEKFKETVVKYGIDGIIIDPFNQVEHKNSRQRDDQKISAFCNRLKKFLLKHDLFCIIVVHTSTIDKKDSGELKMPHMYDNLEGGKMWSKKADNIICYHRPLMAIDFKDTSAIVNVQKIKKKWKTGEPGEIDVRYSLDTNRFYDVNNKTAFSEDDVYNPYGGLEIPSHGDDDNDMPF
jgi:twinkle protein